MLPPEIPTLAFVIENVPVDMSGSITGSAAPVTGSTSV